MPLLIKRVKGEVLDNLKGGIYNLNSIKGSFGYTDWFKIGNLEVFLQDFKYVIDIEEINTPLNIALTFNKNSEFKEIEISY